ncbi:MAG: 3,4-dehydroadipyl-CoA semialdehyde dehydrogenase [Planctomycetota bacterium]
MHTLQSFVLGEWRSGTGAPAVLYNPTTEEAIAHVASGGIDFRAVLDFARQTGGPALRELTFAARAKMLKAMSQAIHAHRDELIELSIKNAGTTRSDAKFDIDGASGTLAAYAQYGEALGEKKILIDGEQAQLGRGARFFGQHISIPRLGAAVHINAFNFPAWNMMEKAACALLAGAPIIEKPGTPTAMVAWRITQIITEAGILPKGAHQFIAGSAGDLLNYMNAQDSLAFTGSSATAEKLRGNANLVKNNVRINIEADSLNAAILGADVAPGSETFGLFINNVSVDITQKTGQKCTAVRRIFVTKDRIDDVRSELIEILKNTKVGDPAETDVRMGPLASKSQFDDVRAGIRKLAASATAACGGPDPIREKGYFVSPTLFVTNDPRVTIVHSEEVFGPVATIVPYSGGAEEAGDLAGLGGGGLVTSVYSNDSAWTEKAIVALAPWHGRIYCGSDKMAEQSLPPGMVLPSLIHGGPGRAGGGEELGALRGLAFYLQRTAVQAFKGQLDKL